jgi:tol-pal system protein YbgF
MKFKFFICYVCMVGILGCVSSGQISYMDQRVTQLEQQNAAMAADLRKSEQTLAQIKQTSQELRSQQAELYASNETVRQELRRVTGKVEETGHKIEKSRLSAMDPTPEKENLLSRLEEMNQASLDRIAKIEQYLNLEVASDRSKRPAGPPEKATLAPTPAPAPTPPAKKELPENELYESAKQAFDKGESENARDQFLEYLKRFPKAKNANNAQFWIGEIYYRDKWYEKAIMEYQKVIEKYPDGNKVPAALLKQGLSFFNLNEKPNARLILQEIVRKYPTSNEAKIAKEKLSTF